ncbi:unnamed protein product [Larinioides sclopetarius]|uniref:WAP domain-containing protein n=1 Tax=Larinioides sclopetarius TaxID=280406 RepID=A0AAV2B691_9ARAC
MHFYVLFIVFLYVGGCNARVVPLDFKLGKCKHVNHKCKFIDESPNEEVEMSGRNLPDIGEKKNLEPLNSEEENATVAENSSRNASNLTTDLIPKTKAMDEKSNLENNGSSAISDLLEEKLNSTTESISQNSSNSRDSFETIQVNGTLNDKIEDLKNETTFTNNSLVDLELRNNLEFVKIDELNDTLDQSETFDVANSDHNETFASFEATNTDQNETFASFEATNTDQNETFASFEATNTDQNETFASFEAVNDQNKDPLIFETVNGTNSTKVELQPLTNDTEIEAFPNEAENFTEKLETNNLTSENPEQTNDSVKTAGGIFSGFEFLINSEVARNAAKAMEVFNFSDPLTDHIIEENEFHSFLPAFNAAQDLDSSNQTDVKTTAILTNSSEESSEIRTDFNTSLSSRDETLLTLNQTEAEKTKNSSMSFNRNESLEGANKTELFDLKEKIEENATSEKVSPPSKNSGEKIQLSPPKSTISKENITSPVSNSSTVGVPECPTPGWCIFWFLSQDACATNEHCLGSRICCKIGCSKTCIEIESPR